ncbi:hypothetical protein MRX96_021576 [Rhipicephalus microplus]
MSAAGMADERTHTPATTVDEPATTVDGPSTEVRGSHTPSPVPYVRMMGSIFPRPQLTPGTANEASHTPATSADGPFQATHNPTPLRGRSQNEATLAFLEARYNQDIVMRLLSYQIDRRKLHLKIRQNEDNMKLLPQQHADDVRLRQAEVEMRRMEMVAVLEERRANAAYQASQLELIKGLIE